MVKIITELDLLFLVDGQKTQFAQLYIYDTKNEIANKIDAITSGDHRKIGRAHV